MTAKKETTLKLRDFASVDAGYPLRRGQTSSGTEYAYRIFPAASDPDKTDVYFSGTPVPERYLTREKDILVHTGNRNDVTLIGKDREGLLVTDRYLIIRCDESKAVPAYIRMALCDGEGLAKRKKLCRDAVLPYRKAQKYEELKFRLPGPEMQELQVGIREKAEESLREYVGKRKERQDLRDERRK